MKLKHVKALIANLEVGSDNQAPEWVLLFKEGLNHLEDGSPFVVDRQSFDLLMAYLQKRGVEIVWDYEHQTVFTNDKAPASGWSKEYRYTEGRGIEVRVAWTDEAATYITKKEYRYFSPVFYTRKSDSRVVGLHSIALTNTPKTNNLEPLLAKLGADDNPTEQEGTMKFFEKLIAKLGMAEGSTEDQVLAAVAELQKNGDADLIAAKAEVPGDIIAALGLDEGDTSVVVASIHALKQTERGMVSQEEFKKLQAKLAARDAEEAVDAAVGEGKITPDQKDWALNYAKSDLAGFKLFVSKAAVVVPIKDLPRGDSVTHQPTMDETTLQVAKMFGNSEDDLKQHGGLT
jgi:phage I-like protein